MVFTRREGSSNRTHSKTPTTDRRRATKPLQQISRNLVIFDICIRKKHFLKLIIYSLGIRVRSCASHAKLNKVLRVLLITYMVFFVRFL